MKEKKVTDLLFEPIGIWCSSRTKIRFLDDWNDPGIAIGTRAIWKCFERITLTEHELDYIEKWKKKKYMCRRKGVTVVSQLPLDHLHDVGRWSKWREAEVDHPGTSLFHLPSEKGNPSTRLRVLVNRYSKWVTRGTHQTTHSGQVLPIQLQLVPDSPRLWQVRLSCNTKRLWDYWTSQSRVWKSMNEKQRRSKMLEGIMKYRPHQGGLDGE